MGIRRTSCDWYQSLSLPAYTLSFELEAPSCLTHRQVSLYLCKWKNKIRESTKPRPGVCQRRPPTPLAPSLARWISCSVHMCRRAPPLKTDDTPPHLTSAPSHIWECSGGTEVCAGEVLIVGWRPHVGTCVEGIWGAWRRWSACERAQVVSWNERNTERLYLSVNTFPVNRLRVESKEPWPLLLYSNSKR